MYYLQVFVIHDNIVIDVKQDQCLLPAETGEVEEEGLVGQDFSGQEEAAKPGSDGDGDDRPDPLSLSSSDLYDVAPPVYELNTSAAAALIAAERRRATSGGESERTEHFIRDVEKES